MTEQRCDTCVFWTRARMFDGTPATFGHCKRYPPNIDPRISWYSANAVWPRPYADAWCGEWTVRPELETP